MVRWYDGLYGGLLAGGVLVTFYWVATLTLAKDLALASFFSEIASGILKNTAAAESGWTIAFGVALYVLLTATFGIIYAVLARFVRAMWNAPTSVLFGLGYGLLVWFFISDVLVPVFGIVSTQPLWLGLVSDTVFYGYVISEFITIVQRSKSVSSP
jgi:hypothetical protein